MVYLRGLTNLKSLILFQARITDAGMEAPKPRMPGWNISSG